LPDSLPHRPNTSFGSSPRFSASTLPAIVRRRHILGRALPKDDPLRLFESLPKWPEDLSGYDTYERRNILVRVENALFALRSDLEVHRHLCDSLIASYSCRDVLSPEHVGKFARRTPFYTPQIHQGAQLGFLLVGPSGSGKTTSIKKALAVAVPKQPVLVNDGTAPGGIGRRIGYLYLECSHDGRRAGIVNSFFHAVSAVLNDPSYANRADRSHNAVEQEIHEMANLILLLDVGIIVIDEVQRIFESHVGGEDPMLVMNFLAAMVNSLQIPVVFVATPDVVPHLEAEEYLDRRSKGMVKVTIGGAVQVGVQELPRPPLDVPGYALQGCLREKPLHISSTFDAVFAGAEVLPVALVQDRARTGSRMHALALYPSSLVSYSVLRRL
jgi:hypothetical protein